MKKKTMILPLLFLLSIQIVSGYGFYNQNELNNSQTEYNMTFPVYPFEEIVWITIPRRGNITTANWSLRGYPYTTNNVTLQEDLDTYSNNAGCSYVDRWRDGDYNTWTYTLPDYWCYVWANYTKPENATFGRTYVYASYSAYIYQIPQSCWDYDPNNLQFFGNISGADFFLWQCRNATDWVILFDARDYAGSNANFHEERMEWNDTYYPENVTIDTGNDGSNDYINDTIFNTSEDIDLNATAINNYLWNVCPSGFFQDCNVPIKTSSIIAGYGEISAITVSGSYISSNLSVDAFNEETGNPINFNITITNGTATYNATGCSNTWVELVENLPTGSVTVYVSSSGFIQRTYYISLSQDMNTNLEAYLLSSGTGIYHSTFVIASNNNVPIEDALVTVQIDQGSYYSTVEQHYTDTTGLALNFLDPVQQYHFIVSADDYVSQTYDIYPNPVSPIVYVRLAYTGVTGADFVNYSVLWDSISYQFLPDTFYHNDSFDATFELSGSDNDIDYMGLNVTYQNTSLICNEYVDSQPAGTTLTCTIPYVVGRYEVQGYFRRGNYSEHQFNIFYYWVYNSTSGGLQDIDIAGTMSDLGYWIVCIFLTMLVCGFASRFIGFGAGYLAVGMMAMAVALNPTIVIAGTTGWMIIGLMVLALISLTIIRAYI